MPQVKVSFAIDQPIDRIWQFLQNVPEVAPCMPGVELTGTTGPATYQGKVRVKLGPVVAAFEGEASITEIDPREYRGKVEGKGIDKKGGSRASATVVYRLTETGPSTTTVDITSDFNLTGALAQMGRTGIFQDVATQLTNQFAVALRERLARESRAEASPASDRPESPQPAAASARPSAPTTGPSARQSAAPQPASGGSQISVWRLLGAIISGSARRVLTAFARLFRRAL